MQRQYCGENYIVGEDSDLWLLDNKQKLYSETVVVNTVLQLSGLISCYYLNDAQLLCSICPTGAKLADELYVPFSMWGIAATIPDFLLDVSLGDWTQPEGENSCMIGMTPIIHIIVNDLCVSIYKYS